MRRVVLTIALMLLGGCGSCLEEKKAPEQRELPTPGPAQTVLKTLEGGAKQPVVVGNDGFSVSRFVKHDGGADAGM